MFLFLDCTAVLYGYNLTKAVMESYWAGFMAGLYVVLAGAVLRMFFRLVNN